MEKAIARRFFLSTASLFLLFLWLGNGCIFRGFRGQARLNPPSDCLEKQFAEVFDFAEKSSRNTPKQSLECALYRLRGEWFYTVKHARIACKVAFLLADCEQDRERQKALASEGVKWGELGFSLGGAKDAELAYYYAMNLGLAVQDNPVLALKNIGRIEEKLLDAVKMDPAVDMGGPVRVLAMLYLKAPPWPQGPGDPDKALMLLRWVAHHFGEHPLNHIFLARAYLEVIGEDANDKVRQEIERALALMARRHYGCAQDGWRKMAMEVVEEAGIEFKDPSEAP